MNCSETWRQISIYTKMACGAREAVDCKDRLMFRVTIKPGQSHKVTVRLNGLDLYDVELIRIKRKLAGFEVVKSESNVYGDMLSETIYDMCNKGV
tara:strand:+ start:787 stop:1071 length:285 start_codon:yes stop_codon:yes gene_type:complete